MKTLEIEQFTLYDFEPTCENFSAAVLSGLSRQPKSLPCKFFYDAEGSRLFDAICKLDEYYLTRTETALLQDSIAEITDLIGPASTIVEFGSGTSEKTKILLDNLSDLHAYVPVDISKSQLIDAASHLSGCYRNLLILPVCADYTSNFNLPHHEAKKVVVFFPGSTIGNFEPAAAITFLRQCSRLAGVAGGILIGVDLKKDKQVIEAAYNDSSGITAAFNLNLLDRISREFGVAAFSQHFDHQAVYNELHGRVEMYLVSRLSHALKLNGQEVSFDEGEKVLTEYCYKYSVEDFHTLSQQAGLKVEKIWTDANDWFSIHYLTTAETA